MIPQPLQQLMQKLARLPGLGPRSAQRAALHLLTNPERLHELQRSLIEVANTIKTCTVCGNISLEPTCHICSSAKRSPHILCVVEGIDDLWALERCNSFTGQYHVLGGTVSALDGIGPEQLGILQLVERVKSQQVQEVILALSASVDGQTTAHLVARKLEELPGVTITSLAKGMPMGADVDYLDDGTLALALEGRRAFG